METPATSPTDGDRADLVFKERELSVREQELELKKKELLLKEADQRYGRWFNPLFLGLVAATITLAGNFVIGRRQAATSIEQERIRSQSNLILEAIRTGDADRAAKNLNFFLELGFIDDANGKIKEYLARQQNVPVLPSAGLSDELTLLNLGAPANQQFYVSCRELNPKQAKDADRIFDEYIEKHPGKLFDPSGENGRIQEARPDGGIKFLNTKPGEYTKAKTLVDMLTAAKLPCQIRGGPDAKSHQTH